MSYKKEQYFVFKDKEVYNSAENIVYEVIEKWKKINTRLKINVIFRVI